MLTFITAPLALLYPKRRIVFFLFAWMAAALSVVYGNRSGFFGGPLHASAEDAKERTIDPRSNFLRSPSGWLSSAFPTALTLK
jgi:hypothetical protein